MCLQVILDAEFVLANLDAARRNTSPLVKQGIASDRDLPGLQNHACKRQYVSSLITRPVHQGVWQQVPDLAQHSHISRSNFFRQTVFTVVAG